MYANPSGEFVVKGKNAGLGLLRVEWRDYLAQLASHPNVGIEVEIAAPNRGFVSERERRNPFLQQQQLLTIKYTETIEPAKVYLPCKNTGSSCLATILLRPLDL